MHNLNRYRKTMLLAVSAMWLQGYEARRVGGMEPAEAQLQTNEALSWLTNRVNARLGASSEHGDQDGIGRGPEEDRTAGSSGEA